mgnify:CR=1 FL=1
MSAIIFADFFSGEFERAQPSNQHLPYFAYDGLYCLGTDLSGQGSVPYLYENGILPGTAYTATSPSMDVSSYSNLTVSFASWIVIQQGDSLKLEVSPDHGATWVELWAASLLSFCYPQWARGGAHPFSDRKFEGGAYEYSCKKCMTVFRKLSPNAGARERPVEFE